MFQVVRNYLVHSGGTKFYETILIVSKDAGVPGPAILIKRYGPQGKQRGGGQTLIERGTWRQMLKAQDEILAQKRKTRNGGQYDPRSFDHGLHAKVFEKEMDAIDLGKVIPHHYEDVKVRTAIEDYFDVAGQAVMDGSMFEAAEVPEGELAEDEPEPVRGPEWGSF